MHTLALLFLFKVVGTLRRAVTVGQITIRHGSTTNSIHMSPLWGFGYLVYAARLYTCRPAGAKCRIESLVTDMSAIVGARSPRPMGWVTQPLRVQWCGSVMFFNRCFRLNGSNLPIQAKRTCRPSGALVIWCMLPGYKHVAPLGLNAESNR